MYSSTRSLAGKCSFSSVVFIWFLDLGVKFVVIIGGVKSFLLISLLLSELGRQCYLHGCTVPEGAVVQIISFVISIFGTALQSFAVDLRETRICPLQK